MLHTFTLNTLMNVPLNMSNDYELYHKDLMCIPHETTSLSLHFKNMELFV